MRARSATLVMLALGIGFGVAAEWASYDSSNGPALAAADFAVGCLLIGCGVIAWNRRSESRVGLLMNLAGFTWFVGTAFEAALYLHRGPLVHLYLSYPSGRLRTWTVRTVVVIAYVDALVEPVASNSVLTLVLSALVAIAAVRTFQGSSGPARRAGGPALAAALAFAAVLAFGAVNELTGLAPEHTVLWIYDLVIASITIVLTGDLLRGRWSEAVVTGLVVDLGSSAEAGTLRAKLADALGDPSLVVGYRFAGPPGYVDDGGRPVEIPHVGSGKTTTPLFDRGEEVAILVHDEALMADSQLFESVAAAARIAVSNAGLQAEARAQANELEGSRRRILEIADSQRRRLEQELRLGAGRRLEEVAVLLSGARKSAASSDAAAIALLEGQLTEARRDLEELARGIQPEALTEEGLMAALEQLAEHSPIFVEVEGKIGRLPGPIEVALYFVCSEALANVAKHARASRASIQLRAADGRVALIVADDGAGGADISDGTGLRGLADRVEALGGKLELESPPDNGTRLAVELPVDD